MTKIVIDPGHGGTDPGATNGSHQEKTFTLAIALKVRDYLQSRYRATVLMTRTTDKTVSLPERSNFANRERADYFCSIHINSGRGTGWESFIYNGTVNNATIQAQQTIHQYVMSVLSGKYGVRDRGKKRDNFHVLRETTMPAILLENLFIDTTEDLNLLNNHTFIADLANAIGEGLARALSLAPANPKMYKVIAGSFKNKQNALDRVQHLQKHGISSFVVEVTISGEKWYRVQAGAFRDRSNAEARLREVQKTGVTDAFILE
ncbi:N-acetylmuramoyl-L-alanine amidase [Numidum massiliense]|uniref:N-acetylmuramoyl-L-alanine amidase n=1 Tax=Numidum massiliense TaxID=1522315 RepID=UPI00093B003F|nr:N-acetylmuramoyl-L-alanine amidase [Numidum massiliense]